MSGSVRSHWCRALADRPDSPKSRPGRMGSDLSLDLGFAVDTDGSRFLVTRVTPEPGSELTGWILIQNWLASAVEGGGGG